MEVSSFVPVVNIIGQHLNGIDCVRSHKNA